MLDMIIIFAFYLIMGFISGVGGILSYFTIKFIIDKIDNIISDIQYKLLKKKESE